MTNEQILELQKYADMEGTELGEYANILIHLLGYSDYAMDDAFMDQVRDEAERALKMFQNDFRIEEREVVHKRTIRSLIYKDE